ncbi:LysR family transcriptional regulator [Martelella mediterranea]|uniref:Ben and cat operon transcriptional regulator n=1 Tax=Martelella mediterranea DSM 17316 TaxID=1122214 RepID=A0A1U9YY69_9HYPH|nr:LysR family transcriptional regulator [Martelella mediterranea]AQZ50340.1 Ben and cat operon transcriptional regulator [Martelella mediterranea DSM 17316]
MAMRIIDMATFVALARNRHFGRTARELNTTQPAISSRLAILERDYACRLVERGDREFRLTPAGEEALRVFQEVLEKLNTLKSDLKEGGSDAAYIVRIGAIDSVVATWMPDFIEALSQAMPNLRVELTIEGTRDLIAGLAHGEFDLIFGIEPAIGDSFRSFIICYYEMVWAAAPAVVDRNTTYSVDELSRMPIITFPKGTPPYAYVAPYFQDERVLASKLTSSNSLFAMINLLIGGFGLAAIPSVAIARELENGLLCRVSVTKPFPPMPIVATYQTTVGQNILRSVADHARSSAAEFCRKVSSESAWVPGDGGSATAEQDRGRINR